MEKAEFAIVTIWKNQLQFGPNKGEDYWAFVLEDGSRVSCFDRALVESLDVDPDERMTKFDEPLTVELNYVMNKDKIKIVPEDYDEEAEAEKEEKPKSTFKGKKTFAKKSFSGGGFKKQGGGKDNDEIARMNVLRTVVEFLAYQKVKTLAELKKLVPAFESYVKKGTFEDKK